MGEYREGREDSVKIEGVAFHHKQFLVKIQFPRISSLKT